MTNAQLVVIVGTLIMCKPHHGENEMNMQLVVSLCCNGAAFVLHCMS